MPNHITSLNITGLRGVSQTLTLTLEKPLTLIYGENGTGKTSICDSVDFIGNGEVGSLSDISTGGQKHRYWPFIDSPAANINVYLELKDGQNWTATSAGRSVNVTNEDTRPQVKVWRRKQLIDLILAKPADRFSVIKPFIDISEIENSEAKLRELKREVDSEINSASQRIAENLLILNNIRKSAGDTTLTDIEWATKELEVPIEDVDDEILGVQGLAHQIGLLVSAIGILSEQKQALDQAIETNDEAKQEYAKVRDDFDEKVEQTIDVLTASQQYFHEHNDINECPVCLSKENINGLSEAIDQKLNTLAEVSRTKIRVAQTERNKESAAADVEESTEAANNALKIFKDGINKLEPYAESYEIIADALEVNNLEDVNITKLENIKQRLEARGSSLAEAKGARNSLQAALDAYNENMAYQSQSSAKRPVVERLLEIHETKRKAYVDGILASIAGEVGRLYEQIHEGEGLNRIALQLDPGRRASLEIQSEFLTHPVPPGAYFSNSHLDSLGLCILIAIAKLEGAENTILVMDDILGSIDEPHVDRIIELLYAESPNFLHMLVTTHYQAWHFKIRRGQLRNANCQLVELGKWDSGTGVTVRDSGRSLLVILEKCVRDHPNEPEPIASHAGHLLEQLGDFIVSKYACSVPKRITGNTLNDYLDALKPKFIQHLKAYIRQEGATPEEVTYIEVQLSPIIEELKDIYQVRNTTGSHYNEMANHMPVADILRFGELVIELCNALICPDNGFPNKQKQGTYWATTGETRQLHPLVKP